MMMFKANLETIASWLSFSLCWYVVSTQSVHEIELDFKLREETAVFTRIGTILPRLPANIASKVHFLTHSIFFSVTQTGGDIQVSRLIDRENLCSAYKMCCGVIACQIEATVYVTEKVTGDLFANVKLKVDIQDQNDNRPEFATNSQVVSISESALLGTLISLIPATDADIDQINQIQRYTLREPTGTFALDLTALPAVRLQLVKVLDHERSSSYSATLEACDPGACAKQTLDIRVTDENDNHPVFTDSTYTINLMEDVEVGSLIIQLNATDADSGERGKVLYSIRGKVDSDLLETFELVRDTGEISLKRQLAANIRTMYRFTVIACDAVRPQCNDNQNSTVEIRINVEDVNNYPPSIQVVAAGTAVSSSDPAKPTFNGDTDGLSIPENTQPSPVAVITVSDEDVGENARVSCTLNESDSYNLPRNSRKSSPDFILINSSPGFYSLRTAHMFDYEVEPTVSTKIVCHDYGSPQRLTAGRVITVHVIDVNEYPPEFSRRVYVGRVQEGTKAGIEVLSTTATDRDRAAVLQYRFGEPPIQQGIQQSVESNQLDDTSIDQMGPNKYFVMELKTGIIRTSQIPIDREEISSVTLVVLVTDSKYPPVYTATTTVSIEVIDTNDNTPIFVNPPVDLVNAATGIAGPRKPKAFSVKEHAPPFTRLDQKLEARDPDQGKNGEVHFSLLKTYSLTRTTNIALQNTQSHLDFDTDHNWNLFDEPGMAKHIVDQPVFKVTSDGEILTLVELDRESVPSYVLEIGVNDRGAQPLGSSTLLRVNVIDMNDNAPVWEFPTPGDQINLTTVMKPGSRIGELRAYDTDEFEAGRVSFTLLGERSEPLKATNIEDGLLRNLSPEYGKKSEEQTLYVNSNHLDLNGYRVGPLYLNGTTGDIWVAQPLSAGTLTLHLRAYDNGEPKLSSDAWLTINVIVDPREGMGFLSLGADGTLNITIILIMITITAVVSLLLIVGIICVRRRPARYTAAHLSAARDGTASPGNITTTFSMDTNKEGYAAGTWSPLGMYTGGQYLTTHGTLGTPIIDDGQMFTTMGSPGMMGYGAMLGQNETGSVVYMPQPPPPPNAMAGSMTPMPIELSTNGSDFSGRNQMHTFGTLTRTRGSVSGAFYPAPVAACPLPYEPHLDADSGDSGRGPSEEGNQFLLGENYRHNGSQGNSCPYNTYSGYRSSSRNGYYRNGLAESGDTGGTFIKVHALNCSHSGPNGSCACYLLPENNMFGATRPCMAAYDPMELTAANFQIIDGQQASLATNQAPASPYFSESSLARRRLNNIATAEESALDSLSGSIINAPKFNANADAVQSMSDNQPNGTQQETVDSIKPLRIDLRNAQTCDLINPNEHHYDSRQSQRIHGTGINPGLPPLATKFNGHTSLDGLASSPPL